MTRRRPPVDEHAELLSSTQTYLNALRRHLSTLIGRPVKFETATIDIDQIGVPDRFKHAVRVVVEDDE